jgi:hypothetical protein
MPNKFERKEKDSKLFNMSPKNECKNVLREIT